MYGAWFIRLFGFQVRVRNRLAAFKRRVQLHFMKKRSGTEADMQTLRKFTALVPTLSQYNPHDALEQLRIQALSHGCRSLEAFYDLAATRPELLQGNLTFVGSHFFRGSVWPALRKACEAAFSGSGRDRIRIWCAGCASGKEVYSVLMLLLDLVPAERIELLATDYNQEMLRLCQDGVYSLRTIDEIPREYLRYTEKYRPEKGGRTEFSQRRQFRFRLQLRGLVQTRHLNLLVDPYPEGMDLILCRNVIKFFDGATRLQVQQGLARALNPGGLLVVSDEDLDKEGIRDPQSLGLRQIEGSCIYRK